jgi:hypothetical protein
MAVGRWDLLTGFSVVLIEELVPGLVVPFIEVEGPFLRTEDGGVLFPTPPFSPKGLVPALPLLPPYSCQGPQGHWGRVSIFLVCAEKFR